MEQRIVIKKLIAGGLGLGRLASGMAALVPGVLPGEEVLIRGGRVRRGYMEAGEIQVLAPSPERVSPACPHYGDCGGCDLQHASAAAQLAIKDAVLRESLDRGHVDCSGAEFLPPLAAPLTFAYRHRLRLHLDEDGRPGFHRRATRELVPVRRCLLATAAMNRVLAALWEEDEFRRLGAFAREVEIFQSPEQGHVFLLCYPRDTGSCFPELFLFPGMKGPADAVAVQGREREDEGLPLSQDFTLSGLSYRLEWDHRCFFQSNARQCPHLVEQALAFLGRQGFPATMLDLFCGMGTFSIPAGLAGAVITGLEHNRHSIRAAEGNSRKAGLGRARFIAGDAGKGLENLVRSGARFEAVLFDPPRQGLGKDTVLLARLFPRRILAVSCDPATLARDLCLLTAQGYRLRAIRAVDMFPQTHHVESLALLERN